MNGNFLRNLKVTSPFFLLRFIASCGISVLYFFVAATIQYLFVKMLGESTFNYIVGGLLSLFLGVIICNLIGSLCFIFVKGWHIAALAYVSKIIRSGAPVLTVGMKAFSKNFISFGVIYGIRLTLKNAVSGFKEKIWDISDDIPYVDMLRKFADNPIVEYISKDILNYGFDSTMYYLIRFPAKDSDEIPTTIITAIKKYLCALPDILIASVQTYLCFKFIPRLLKWILIIYIIVFQGLVAGILITVLMFPIFYLLNNVLFDPITMIVFISAYSKHCKKDIDENSPIVQFVNSIIDGVDGEESQDKEGDSDRSIGTSSADFRDVGETDEDTSQVEDSEVVSSEGSTLPDQDSTGDTPRVSAVSEMVARLQSGAVDIEMRRHLGEETEETEEFEDIPDLGFSDGDSDDSDPIMRSIADIFRGFEGLDINEDPDSGDDSHDRAQDFLSGGDE